MIVGTLHDGSAWLCETSHHERTLSLSKYRRARACIDRSWSYRSAVVVITWLKMQRELLAQAIEFKLALPTP
eukprot:125192-Amphidinium_carterae.1